MKFQLDHCKSVYLWLAISCGLLLVVAMAVFFIQRDADSPQDIVANNQLVSDQAPPPASALVGRYLLAGTLVWDRGVETWSKVNGIEIDPNQPFSGLDTYNPEQYDAWVADLECPTSALDLPEEAGADHRLEFNCRQEYLTPARSYFEFFNLANNHSDNSGRDKLEETRQALTQAGFQHFGDPEPGYLDNICEVVGLPVRLFDGDEVVSAEARLPVAFCAWHYFYRQPLPGEIEVIAQYAELMPVFAFVHMGREYLATADSIQRSIARRIIDAGAEFVVGNNPHWVQDAEVHRGKLIIYSTGNFIFDQQWSQEVRTSVSLDLSLEANYDAELQKWLDLGPECLAYQDDCLDQAIAQGLTRLSLDFNYDVIAGDLTNRLQTRGSQQLQTWVEERLGWQRVLHILESAE